MSKACSLCHLHKDHVSLVIGPASRVTLPSDVEKAVVVSYPVSLVLAVEAIATSPANQARSSFKLDYEHIYANG